MALDNRNWQLWDGKADYQVGHIVCVPAPYTAWERVLNAVRKYFNKPPIDRRRVFYQCVEQQRRGWEIT